MPDLDRVLAALADKDRRRAVEILRAGALRPGELAIRLALSRPAMSRHLRVLRDASLVRADELAGDARGRLLHLRLEPFLTLRDWVAETEDLWRGQLAAFAAYAEALPPEPT